MEERRYYSMRTGRNQGALDLDLPTLIRLFSATYFDFKDIYYFQKAFGYDCVDAGFVPGTTGRDTKAYFLKKLRKDRLWPIEDNLANYSEDDLFDVIELLFDLIAKPVDGYYHEYCGCGWHYRTFDEKTAQSEFRTEINEFLRDYKEGYELSEDGEILIIGDTGFELLLETEIPEFDPDNIDNRLQLALLKFRRYRSSDDEKREAVRALADILEYIRDEYNTFLPKKDESDLFNIINNYGIRHHTTSQKTDYDPSIWLPWMFYTFLASIHLSLRLIKEGSLEKYND